MTSHEEHMRQAVRVAGMNAAYPFGTVLVDRETNQIVAEGVNRGQENPTWHGEIDAINRFAAAESEQSWSQLSLYTTAEPCPMCQSAILWAGISRVYYG